MGVRCEYCGQEHDILKTLSDECLAALPVLTEEKINEALELGRHERRMYQGEQCCIPIRTWALHPLQGEEAEYFGRVMHSYMGSGLGEIARCTHRHKTREEAQTCANGLKPSC